jgi:hypothetical protein
MEHIEILKNKGIKPNYMIGLGEYLNIEDLWDSTNRHQYLLLNIIDSYSLFENRVEWINLLYKLMKDSYIMIHSISYNFNKTEDLIFSDEFKSLIEFIGNTLNSNENSSHISEVLINHINSTLNLNDKYEIKFSQSLHDFLLYGSLDEFKTMVEIIAWVGSRYMAFESIWDTFMENLNITNDINLSWNNLSFSRNKIWDLKRDDAWEYISVNQCNIIRSLMPNPFNGNELKSV